MLYFKLKALKKALYFAEYEAEQQAFKANALPPALDTYGRDLSKLSNGDP